MNDYPDPEGVGHPIAEDTRTPDQRRADVAAAWRDA